MAKQEKQDLETQKTKDKDKKTPSYKERYLKLKEEFQMMEHKIKIATLENTKNLIDFHNKVKELQDSAKEKIEKAKHKIITQTKKNEKIIKRYSLQKLIEKLIDPLLNMEIAINNSLIQNNEQLKSYVLGFDMLVKEIFNVLKDNGLSEIDPKIGEEYDPKYHEILKVLNPEDTKKVIKEVKRKGFILHNRVIKPALVII